MKRQGKTLNRMPESILIDNMFEAVRYFMSLKLILSLFSSWNKTNDLI